VQAGYLAASFLQVESNYQAHRAPSSSWDFAKNKMRRDANFDWQYYPTG
jgi:hypothetical protein